MLLKETVCASPKLKAREVGDQREGGGGMKAYTGTRGFTVHFNFVMSTLQDVKISKNLRNLFAPKMWQLFSPS